MAVFKRVGYSMPIAWLTIPSARPEAEARACVQAWRVQGYSVAMLRNGRHACPVGADYEIIGEYPGYAQSCNRLIREVFAMDSEAQFCVAAGDDTFPDQSKRAEVIAGECERYFMDLAIDKRFPGLRQSNYEGVVPVDPCMKTFGVCQPTGHRWGESPNHHDPKLRSAYIDRVAGSAFIGREFARRAYGGNGPFYPEYTHQFLDEELREVAVRLGVYWERRDLAHEHRHWGVPKQGQHMAMNSDMPDFLREANSPAHWTKFRTLFERRKAAGFADALELAP